MEPKKNIKNKLHKLLKKASSLGNQIEGANKALASELKHIQRDLKELKDATK